MNEANERPTCACADDLELAHTRIDEIERARFRAARRGRRLARIGRTIGAFLFVGIVAAVLVEIESK